MDPLLDPFGAQTPTPTEAPSDTFASLSQQWGEFLADPHGRSALANFGLALMQPVGVGQTALGHVGQAVGHTGTALAQQTEQERKQALAENTVTTSREKLEQGADRLDLGYAQMQSREDRTAANLQLKREIAEAKGANDTRRADLLQRQLDIRERYDQGRLDIGGRNAASRESQAATSQMNAETRRQQVNNPSFNALFRANERSQNRFAQDALMQAREIEKRVNDPLGLAKPLPGEERFKGKNAQQIAAELATDPQFQQNWQTRRGAASPTVQGGTEAESGVQTQIEDAPPNAQARIAGRTYNTPRGPMKWTGTGWLPAR